MTNKPQMNAKPLLPLLLLGLLMSLAKPSFAQHWGDVDTVRLAGLQPGLRIADIAIRAHCNVDTVFWGGSGGASIFGFTMPYFEVPGEYKIATDALGITQVSFVAAPKDAKATASGYTNLIEKLEKRLGPPNEVYNNGFRFVTWRGAKQELTVKTKDDTHYLTVVLMKPEKPTTNTVSGAAAGELQPTRKRK